MRAGGTFRNRNIKRIRNKQRNGRIKKQRERKKMREKKERKIEEIRKKEEERNKEREIQTERERGSNTVFTELFICFDKQQRYKNGESRIGICNPYMETWRNNIFIFLNNCWKVKSENITLR